MSPVLGVSDFLGHVTEPITHCYGIVLRIGISTFRRSDGDNKASEATKRKLSADLMLTRAHLQLKDREGWLPDMHTF